MALKIDTSKAYDRVDWDFLEYMLGKLGSVIVSVDHVMC